MEIVPTAVAPPLRIALRSAKQPWDARSPLHNYRRNLFRNNVGNLVFSHAAHRALSTSGSIVTSNHFAVGRQEAARINAEADVFVVPLANAFRPSFAGALGRLTDLIEQLTVPVVVLGVAAQGTVDRDAGRLDALRPAVTRFAAAVLDRSASIGVRGTFTADYLSSLGFSDVDVIGCPAMYLRGGDLKVEKASERLAPDGAVSIGVSPYVKAMGPILTHHLDRYPNLTYIAQDISTLAMMVTGRQFDRRAAPADLPVGLGHRVFTEGKSRFFLDPPPWLAHLSTREFYLGSRIHGSMMALLAGTPATVLVHDSRTLELAEFHRIPHRRISDPDSADATRLYDELDLAPMHQVHQANFSAYRAFLERNGLPHIWQDGESGADFDRRVEATRYPGAVEMPSGIRRLRAQASAWRVHAGRSLGPHLHRGRGDLELGAQRPQQRVEAQVTSSA